LIVSLESGSSVPPYEQVRASLARQITDGTLAVGTKLPTVRALAVEIGIAPNTIARAYRELEEAGLIETRGRAGSFVSSGGDEAKRLAREAALVYASTCRSLGVSVEDALAIVRAAFR
jgi:DNA-binding transcriptional regulator YhcF (GntR family)